MPKTRDIAIGSISTLVAMGGAALVGGLVAQKKLNETLKKSIYVELSPDAPAALKLLSANLNVSMKIQDVYDAATGKKPMPQSMKYFKVTVR